MTEPLTQILTLKQAITWRESLKKNNKKVVVTNGCFDLLHRGHAEYLYQARKEGEALLVLLNADSSVRELKGDSRPVINEENRAYLVASLECVDAVLIFSEPRCDKIFSHIKPDIYVKGGDYTIETLDVDERNVLLDCNAEIKFIPFIPGFSTSDIIKKIRENQ